MSSRAPHSFRQYLREIWLTLQELTTFYLMIFVVGVCSLTNFVNNVNVYMQYYIIRLTNLEAGIDTITTYMALVAGIWIFKRYLINRNWRITQYSSTIISALMSIIWIAPYYNSGGTMNAWFTIFIDLDQQFVQGLAQVLYSMAVIELAKPGLEATTYELLVTVGNAALLVNGIISTQLLTPLRAAGCDDDHCSDNTVDVSSPQAYRASDGPARYTNYTLVLTAISILGTAVFTAFLPKSKEQCQEWKVLGERMGNSVARGKITLAIAIFTVCVSSIVFANVLLYFVYMQYSTE